MANKKYQLKYLLREAAKFIAGLVAADIIVLIWMVTSEVLPLSVLGIEFTKTAANVGVAFDTFLLIVLIHYAWHPGALEPTMSRRAMFVLVGLLTAIGAVVHIARITLGLDLILGGWLVPMWLSWFGAGVSAFISYTSFHLIKR